MPRARTHPTRRAAARDERPHITLRLDLSERARLGRGKIALLEAIVREGSISAAARALGMSYRRAWLLVDSLNRTFREPAVETRPGRARAGARVTPFGEKLVAAYRAIERRTVRTEAPVLRALAAALRPVRARPSRGKSRAARR
ncbi:MAG TPA: LysR family transcriptional regulator [Burkholderiales bacterium]